MGYTPLFDSLTKGTLCGRWPDIGLWPIVLSMSDKNGSIDATQAYIAGVTGLPIADVVACMQRFCEPDPYSRSQNENGARLVLLDGHRDWGWRVVNHEKYREKARKAAYDSNRTDSGVDAERKRTSRDVPRCPASTRADPLSNTNTNTDSNKKEQEGEQARSARPATRLPDDFALTEERRAVGQKENLDVDRVFADFCDYWRALGGAKARKLDWDATWRVWCRNQFSRRGSMKPAPFVAPEETRA